LNFDAVKSGGLARRRSRPKQSIFSFLCEDQKEIPAGYPAGMFAFKREGLPFQACC
jgi:hypothetical protein